MRIEIDDLIAFDDVTEKDVLKALESVKGEGQHFAVLAQGEMNYIQAAGSLQDGFILEYRSGSPSRHYCCTKKLGVRDVFVAFAAYARNEPDWQRKYEWERPSKKPSKVRIESREIDRSLSGVAFYIIFLLMFIVWLAGIRRIVEQHICAGLFVALSAICVCMVTTQSVYSGVVQLKFNKLTRLGNPIRFWMIVGFGYLATVVFCIVAVLAFTQKHLGNGSVPMIGK